MSGEDRASVPAQSTRAALVAALTGDRLVRAVLILLALVLAFNLYETLMRFLGQFSRVLLLFALSWLLALALSPAVTRLSRLELRWRARLPRRRNAPPPEVAPPGSLHRPLAAAVVYGGLAVVFALGLVYFVPVLLAQLDQLRQSVPALVAAAPGWLEQVRRWAEPYGLAPTFTGALDPETIRTWLRDNGLAFAQNALSLASQLASFSVDLFMILTLSVYMLLDGDRLMTDLIRGLPRKWQVEARLLVVTIGVKFGGFLRAVLLQSSLFGAAVLAVMLAARMPYSLIVTLLSAALMVVPVVGGLLAIYLPTLVALIVTQSVLTAVIVYVVLWVYQMILYNAIMPRMVGQIIGLPPLLAFAALLIGGTVGGVWGALFSAPVAAVIAAMIHFLRHRKHPLELRRHAAAVRAMEPQRRTR